MEPDKINAQFRAWSDFSVHALDHACGSILIEIDDDEASGSYSRGGRHHRAYLPKNPLGGMLLAGECSTVSTKESR